MTLTYRHGPMTDGVARAALIRLTKAIFDIDLSPLTTLDAWHPGYRAFSWFDGDRMVANVSTRPIPLVIGGQRQVWAQVHAVSTLPEYRRRGLFGTLMTRAMSDADQWAAGVFLWTGSPPIYTPHGFALQEETACRGRLTAPPEPVRAYPFDWRNPAGLAALKSLCQRRGPVSPRLSALENADVILWNLQQQPGWTLTHLPDHDAILIHDGPRLLDILSPRLPPQGALSHIMGNGKIRVLFPPDGLQGDFTPEPHAGEEGDILMVRGLWPAGTMLPPTALA